MKVENVIIHEFREEAKKVNLFAQWDIALLKLADEVDITIHTPVCLPVLGQDYVSPDQYGRYRWATAVGKKNSLKLKQNKISIFQPAGTENI